MADTQTVTLAIPKDVLRKAELFAAKKKITLEEFLIQALTDLFSEVRDEESYEQARQHAMEMLEKGFNLGTKGEIPWNRDDLHERKEKP